MTVYNILVVNECLIGNHSWSLGLGFTGLRGVYRTLYNHAYMINEARLYI